jgi:pilus assembly protein CpaF
MGLMERLEKQKTVPIPEAKSEIAVNSSAAVYTDEFSWLKEKIHSEIIEQLNQEDSGGVNAAQDEFLLKRIEKLVEENVSSVPRAERTRLSKEIYDNVVGLGPLEPYLADPDVTEIMVNGPYSVYVERAGKLHLTQTVFKDNAHVMNVLNRIVSSVG